MENHTWYVIALRSNGNPGVQYYNRVHKRLDPELSPACMFTARITAQLHAMAIDLPRGVFPSILPVSVNFDANHSGVHMAQIKIK